ncbi:MAG: AraC family transcriptional regulator [Ruthenibacterium sp.]
MLIFDEKMLCAPLFCTELTYESGEVTFPPAPFVLALASSGHATLSADSAPLLLGAGSLALARGEVTLTPATDCHLLCVGFTGLAAQAAGEALSQPVLSDCNVCPNVAQLLHALLESDARRGAEGVSVLCYRILCEIANADSAGTRLSKLVADAILAIRQNYAGLYGVEELSAQMGVSKSHLVRVFSAEIGVPPGQYLTKVRVEAAKKLLCHRAYSLEVVATLCGFSGANYLCKVFKKETGTTPNVYRTQNASAESRTASTEAERALFM